MSAHPLRGWIYALVPIIALGLGTDARAEKKVDWTPYLEQPSDRPKVRPTPKATEPAPTKAKSRTQAAKQRPAATAQPTKAKRKAVKRK
jgi:hypothetical protein